MKDVSIMTDRFQLKSLVPKDVTDTYLSWLQNDVVRKYIVYSKQDATFSELREYVGVRHNASDVLFLGIFEKTENKHIGNVKYEPVDCEQKRALMGIMIGDPSWRGKGVAEEVIVKSSYWLKENYQIDHVILGVAKNNKPAISVYERIGFVEKNIDGYAKGKNQILMEWEL